MITYIVHLSGGRTATVQAESSMEVGDRLLFYRDGKPVADIWFLLSAVEGVSVEPEREPRVF